MGGNNGSGSNIKGGGRAVLSDKAEDALISFLMSQDQQKIRSNSKLLTSKHDQQEERRWFLINLVERYERTRLAKQFNKNASNVYSSGNDDESTSDATSTSAAASSLTTKMTTSTTHSTSGGDGAVRVDLVEAIYSKKTSPNATDSKSRKKSSNKKSDGKDYKEGTKKLVVFKKSTTIQDVMKEGKKKLNMKKKPTRCFIVASSKIELDLVGDLSGVSDGTTIYITSHVPDAPQPGKDGNKLPVEADDGAAANTTTTDKDDNSAEEIDFLESVKEAYLRQSNNNTRRSSRKKDGFSRRPIQSHPDFDKHFGKLDPIPEERSSLPAAACRELILRSVQQSQVTVICGATGCGKSTQVPRFLWEGMKASGHGDSANIIVTQPRRVAATSLANRVAHEMGSPKPGDSGSLVGYNVRLDRSVSDSAKIVYCTVGILLRMLVSPKRLDHDEENTDVAVKSNVPLSSVSHVVIDEVHERDVNTDFVLTLLRSVVKLNRHIRIVLMSATASANKFVQYFAETIGKEPFVISIPGRTFPVDIHWLEDCENFASSKIANFQENNEGVSTPQKNNDRNFEAQILSPRASQKIDNDFIRDLLRALVQEQQTQIIASSDSKANADGERKDGAILVFLPGKGEIDVLASVLYKDPMLGNSDGCNILKLHSNVPRAAQQEVFKRAKSGTVKIVLSTNIAETSVTIPDVSHVIDTGRVKENRFNPSTRIRELVTVWTSKASTNQRSGRAGRTSAGKCWRLYSEKFPDKYMLDQTPPEMLRTPLDELILQVCLLFEQRRDEQKLKDMLSKFPKGVCPKKFLGNALDPPSDKHLEEACNHLLEVDAVRIVDSDPFLYRLTPLGYHLSRLPMDTKVGKVLVVGCMLGCLDGALTVAASLSCTKACFLHRWKTADPQFEDAEARRNRLIESGFGGKNWIGGTSKGDSIATIAIYNEWSKQSTDKKKAAFSREHALDNFGLKEISQLRNQFLDCLIDAGFVDHEGLDRFNGNKDDALLTSCCLVAGLYPNICTLMRPRKNGPKGGRLLTKDGDCCRPQSSSFQRERIKNAAGQGKDAYAVYHAKHRSIGTGTRPGDIFLSEISFVSRMALLLFGGELVVKNNAIIVDGWLKFKIENKGIKGAVMLMALKDELDKCMLRHIVSNGKEDKPTEELISVVRQLLSDE